MLFPCEFPMKTYFLRPFFLLCLFASTALAAPAVKDSLLAGMHGTWRVEDSSLPEPLLMTIDVENKSVTVSKGKTSQSDKFSLGFEEGQSIVLIAREHREAMYFEIKDRDTMITKREGKPPRTLKRVR